MYTNKRFKFVGSFINNKPDINFTINTEIITNNNNKHWSN